MTPEERRKKQEAAKAEKVRRSDEARAQLPALEERVHKADLLIDELTQALNEARGERREAIRELTAAKMGAGVLVRKRDKACMECGTTEGLHAHHIKPKALHPGLANDPDNGITLCNEHHKQAHRRTSFNA